LYDFDEIWPRRLPPEGYLFFRIWGPVRLLGAHGGVGGAFFLNSTEENDRKQG
jgi:hypothetical protein